MPALHRALSAVLNIADLEKEEFYLNPNKEWIIFLNISFGSGTGYLQWKIPAALG